MYHELQNTSVAVAFLGKFNPAIITPAWLAGKQLIRESEAENADLKIVHPQITKFDIDWLSFDATPEKIVFRTARESHFMALKDLIVSTFSRLRETPVHAFGINLISQFTLRDEQDYFDFGNNLANRGLFEMGLNNPRVTMVSFTETIGDSKVENSGVMSVDISIKSLKTFSQGIELKSNHHFDNPDGKNAEKLLSIFSEVWEPSLSRARNLNEILWDKM